MKKHYINRTYSIIVIVFIIFFFTSCKSKEAPNVDEIWGKYLNTVASREIVNSIKTSYKIEETKRKNGIYKTTHIIKAPDKIYSEIIYPNKKKILLIMNGKNGIIKMNGKIVRKMDEFELLLYSELAKIFPEYTYTSKNNDIKYIETIMEKGKEYYKIQLNRIKDENYYYLIDKDSFEFYKMISDNETLLEVIERKNIMGVNTFWTTKSIDKKDTIINQVVECEFNIKVNDSIFKLD